MSQAGISDFENSNPQIPTSFVTDSGTAIPLSNVLEILGDTVNAGTNATPAFTTGSGNTVTVEIQVGDAITGAPVNKNNAGLVSFDDNYYAVSVNGYVTPVQPTTVFAYLDTTLPNATGGGTGLNPLIFDVALVNIDSAYDTTTGIFTAPTSGNYLVSTTVTFNQLLASHDQGEIAFQRPIGGPLQKCLFNPGLNAVTVTGYTGVYSQTLTGIVILLATQVFQINLVIRGGTNTAGIQGDAFATETTLSIVKVSE